MDRRELFKILASGFVVSSRAPAQHQHSGVTRIDLSSYEPRFFSKDEYKIVDRLSDIIIPADDLSPGAHDAGVVYFIDTSLHYQPDEAVRSAWHDGVRAVQQTAAAKFQKGFLECAAAQQQELVAQMALNEGMPTNELERFFNRLKPVALQGFCLSEIGMRQYLGYKGNTAIESFPGCQDH